MQSRLHYNKTLRFLKVRKNYSIKITITSFTFVFVGGTLIKSRARRRSDRNHCLKEITLGQFPEIRLLQMLLPLQMRSAASMGPSLPSVAYVAIRTPDIPCTSIANDRASS